MSFPHHLRAGAAGFVLLLAACSDPAGPPDAPPADLTLSPGSGGNQDGRADRPLPEPLQVRVLRDGEPAAGVPIAWHTTDGALESSGATDAEGFATAVWTLPRRGGPAVARAQLANDEGTPVFFRAQAWLPELEIVGGDAQRGTVGEPLSQPLEVRVTREGIPLAGEAVEFSFLSVPVFTGPDGLASASWTLTTVAGTKYGSARIAGLPDPAASFSATAIAGPLMRLDMNLAANSLRFWSTGSKLVVHVAARDTYGNLIRNVPVSWSLTSGKGTLAAPGISGPEATAFVEVTAGDDYAGDISVQAVAVGAEAVSAQYQYSHFMFYGSGWWYDWLSESTITVTPGATVRWVHNGVDPHVIGPAGGAADGMLLQRGAVVERSFSTAGVHTWICTQHDWETFTIVVSP